MSRKKEIDREIINALDAMHVLSEDLAKTPDQWLAIDEAEEAINAAELAIHKVRKTFDQEIPKDTLDDHA